MRKLYKISTGLRATKSQFKADNPGIPLVKDADLTSYGYVWTDVDPMPEGVVVDTGPLVVADGLGTVTRTGRDKTPQELADDLAAWREAEVVSRTQFASACFIAGIITGQEARNWAGGNALPANVEAAIVAAIPDPAEQVVALTKAGAEINVRRNNILIDILAADASFDMSDVEVDQIFALAKWVD